MNILDCTLRDGGYYNAWNFSEDLVNDYLSAISHSGINTVELGLRNFPKEIFLGAFAYTSEDYLNSLSLPDNLDYAVMLDAKTILSSDKSIHTAIHQLFSPKNKSKISLVRIAAYFQEVEASREIALELKNMGYQVAFNLMQASGKASELISDTAKQIALWNSVDILYFADSLGNMDSHEVTRIITALRSQWHKPLGIHTHNNMGRALDNSLLAIESGVQWIDATITGMGRGAGNTATEKLLASLLVKKNQANKKTFNPYSIYELVIQRFEPLKKRYGWGDHLLYFLGAQHNVHPMYIQNMLSNSHLGKEELVGSIKFLLEEGGTNKYDGKLLETALSLSNTNSEAIGQKLDPIFSGRDVLIISNASGTNEHKRALELYIKKYQPIVIGINLVDKIDNALINYFCISHNLKFLSDYSHYQQLNKPLIYPKHRFKESEIKHLNTLPDSINYGVKIATNTFQAEQNSCVIPYDLTIAYALCVAITGQAQQIILAGFDGYDATDKRQQEMISLFQLLQDKHSNLEIMAITPTTYPIKKGSVYALL